MSWKASEIRTLYASVTAIIGNIGTAVPIGKRRYILQIEGQNLFAGVNTLTLSKIELGVPTGLDIFTFTNLHDYIPKPDGVITEDALPLYVIEGSTAALQSFMRGICSAAGTVDFIVRYVDAD
jgi:hypothetical protein